MPVLRSIRERFAEEQPLDGREGRGLPARHRRDGQPDAGAGRRRRRGGALLGQPADHAGRGGGGAGRRTACRCRPRAARTPRRTRKHVRRAGRLGPGHHARRRRRPADAAARAAEQAVERRRGGDHARGCCGCAGSRPRAGSRCPVIAVNESRTERTFNDRYGTGQSALDGILRATNLLLAGRTLVLLGYGATGKGIAQRARGAGAHGDRLRGRPAARARGAHGRLRGDAGARGRRARRPVRDRDRLARRAAARALRAHEGRRRAGQRRPLRRRDRPRRRCASWPAAACARCCRSSSSTTSATAA